MEQLEQKEHLKFPQAGYDTLPSCIGYYEHPTEPNDCQKCKYGFICEQMMRKSLREILFQKTCGNCRHREGLTHGPKDMYFRCKSVARAIQLKRDGAEDGPFLNAVMKYKLFEKTECPFWSWRESNG